MDHKNNDNDIKKKLAEINQTVEYLADQAKKVKHSTVLSIVNSSIQTITVILLLLVLIKL